MRRALILAAFGWAILSFGCVLAAPASAASTEVGQTAFDCGYAGATNTLLPVVDVTRFSGTDTRVTVIMHLYDGPSSGQQIASLSAGRIESDGTITHGASSVEVGATRRYTPWGGAFGDQNFGGGPLKYDHNYTVHVVVTDFDAGDTNVADYTCATGDPPTRTLQVIRAGTGAGSVTSQDGHISCGGACSAGYPDGTSVTLTAKPAAGSRLAGWDAPECSSGASTCAITMTADRTVTANFQTVSTAPAEECHGVLTTGVPPFEVPLGSKSSVLLPNLSFSLASGAFCSAGLTSVTPSPSPTGLALTAANPVAGYAYDLSTLGWRVTAGTGGPPAPPSRSAFEWHNFQAELPPKALGIDLAWHKGEPPEPSVTLAKLAFPLLHTTLLNQGGAFLAATIGPEVDFGLQVNVQKLADLLKSKIKEGESAEAAGEEIAQELKPTVRFVYESAEGDLKQWAQGSDSSFTSQADAAAQEFEDAAAAELPEEQLVDITIAEEIVADQLAIDAEALEATQLVGEEEVLLEVAEFGLLAKAGHHPPVATAADLAKTGTLAASPLRRFKVRRMHVGPFPKRQIRSMATRGVVSISVPTHAGKLLLSTTKLRPRARIGVVAPKLLGGKPHAALLVLAGPGYRATRLVEVYHRVVAVSFKLPSKLAAGTWTIAVQDISGVKVARGSKRLTGKSEIRAAMIKVKH